MGLILALVSSYKDIAVDEKLIAFGEVGLSGEIRAVNMAKQRADEARKLGFTTVLMPEVSVKTVGRIPGLKIVGFKTVREAVFYILSGEDAGLPFSS